MLRNHAIPFNRKKFLIACIIVFMLVAGVGVARYFAPLILASQFHTALDAKNQTALNAMVCDAIPPTSRGPQPVKWNLDVAHTTYHLQFEGLHSAIVHFQGPLTITMAEQTTTSTDSGDMIFYANGLSWCLRSW